MFKLRVGYLISGMITGLILLLSYFWTLPDGKLHIVFCDVGQGDAAYIRFPDGRDMVVDGGPNDKVIGCLSRHMPFWDRHINMVAMTHPQKDHMQGLISVMERYSVDYFLRSDVENNTEGYQKLTDTIRSKKIPVKYVTEGDSINISSTLLRLIWPNQEQITKAKEAKDAALASQGETLRSSEKNVLGSGVVGELNDYSLVFLLSYGDFDALFTGDADQHVEANYNYQLLANKSIEVLKVPHHGSKTGMTKQFIEAVRPKFSVVSVGKNSYGHPTEEALTLLSNVESRVERTDQDGDIEVVSDGIGWSLKAQHKE